MEKTIISILLAAIMLIAFLPAKVLATLTEVTELTPDQVQVFKDLLAPVIEKYKAKYGAEACAAFGIQ